jgi:hypothetical protein
MKQLLLAGVASLSLVSAAPAAMLTIAVFDNGVLEGTSTSIDGTATLNISTDPAFDTLNIAAAGSPFIPHADLSSAVLNVTSATISSLHILTVDVFQSGVTVPGGTHTESTFTVNNLIGLPGPATLSTFWNGTGINSLGAILASHTFPLGATNDTFGPVGVPLSTALFSDAQQYRIAFSLPDQSANDTIQLTTAIPEPSTWAMLGLGFIGLIFVGATRKRIA